MKMLAIHAIARAENAEPPKVLAGEVFDATDAEVEILLSAGAARLVAVEVVAEAAKKPANKKNASEPLV